MIGVGPSLRKPPRWHVDVQAVHPSWRWAWRNLVVALPMWEGTGRNIFDASPSQNHALAYISAPPQWVATPVGTALRFSGVAAAGTTNTMVQTRKNIVLQGPRTYLFYVKINRVANTGRLFTEVRNHTSFDGVDVQVSTTGTVRFSYWSADIARLDISSSSINDGKWHLVVCTWTGDTRSNGGKIYLDGRLNVEGASSLADQGARDSPVDSLGAQEDATSSNQPGATLNGDMADFRHWNVVLTDQQIARIARDVFGAYRTSEEARVVYDVAGGQVFTQAASALASASARPSLAGSIYIVAARITGQAIALPSLSGSQYTLGRAVAGQVLQDGATSSQATVAARALAQALASDAYGPVAIQ
mgnify:CR=1 FL=1